MEDMMTCWLFGDKKVMTVRHSLLFVMGMIVFDIKENLTEAKAL